MGLAMFTEFLPGEFHGQRSLAGYSSWGHKELDTTEQLTLSLYIFSHPYMTTGKRIAVTIHTFHGIWSHNFMANRKGEKWKQCQTLFFWAPKSLQMLIAAMKLKDTYSLEGKL